MAAGFFGYDSDAVAFQHDECGFDIALADEKKIFRIGQRNVEATLAMLERNGVRVVAKETGGHDSRTVKLDLSNGNFTLDVPGNTPRLL